MNRAVIACLLASACGKDTPPPDPVCERVLSTYDELASGVSMLLDKGPHGSPAVFCAKLALVVKGGTALVGQDIRDTLEPALDKLQSLAGTWIIKGSASTQASVKSELVLLRTRVATECAK